MTAADHATTFDTTRGGGRDEHDLDEALGRVADEVLAARTARLAAGAAATGARPLGRVRDEVAVHELARQLDRLRTRRRDHAVVVEGTLVVETDVDALATLLEHLVSDAVRRGRAGSCVRVALGPRTIAVQECTSCVRGTRSRSRSRRRHRPIGAVLATGTGDVDVAVGGPGAPPVVVDCAERIGAAVDVHVGADRTRQVTVTLPARTSTDV